MTGAQAFEALGDGVSDVFTMLAAVCAYEYEERADNEAFCRLLALRFKVRMLALMLIETVRDKTAQAMAEVHKLRAQISRLAQDAFPSKDAGFLPRLPPPSDLQLQALRQIIAAAFIDHVAIRADLVDSKASAGRLQSSARGIAYRAIGIGEDVFIHPSSALFHEAPPEVIVYGEVVRGNKPWMRGASSSLSIPPS